MHRWLYEEALRLDGARFAVDLPTRPPLVVLSTASAVEDVLKTQVHKFGKSANFAEALADVFGEGAFVADSAKGLHQRHVATHFFAPATVRRITETAVVRLTTTLCSIVREAALDQRELDIKRLFELFAADVTTTTGFGIDVQFLTETTHHELLARFDRARQVTLFRQQQPMLLWKLKRLLRVRYEGQLIEDVAWLEALLYKMIQDVLARHAAAKDGGEHDDILSLFLQSCDDQVDVRELRDMAMVLLAAGRKNTTYGLSWAVAMATQHPEAQRKIRDELRANVPELMRGEIAVPSTEQTAQLVYLEAFVRETLRLNTVVPINTRDALEDVQLADGTFLAKGTQVLLSWYAMSRLPSMWGPDGGEFRPERWIDAATGKLRAMSQVELITFSAGRRVCPGKHFAVLEMKMVLAALPVDPRAYDEDATIALSIAGPQLVRPTLVSPETTCL